MSRPFLWMAVALLAAPAVAWLVYRLANGLGFLAPPLDRQHELRRTIVLAVYAFLLFLPVLIYGFEKRWPRAWMIFGVVDGLALLFFAGSGIIASRALWKLRHPEPTLPALEDRPSEPEHAALAAAAPHGPADPSVPDDSGTPPRS
jgi:hypothetical protein